MPGWLERCHYRVIFIDAQCLIYGQLRELLSLSLRPDDFHVDRLAVLSKAEYQHRLVRHHVASAATELLNRLSLTLADTHGNTDPAAIFSVTTKT